MFNLLLRFIWLNLWLVPWLTMSCFDKLRRRWKRSKREFVEILKNTQPGDIVLIRRNYSTPWGYWSHCGMIFDPQKGEVLHATNKKGVEKACFTRFCCFYELAVIKPNVSKEQKEQAVKIAEQQIGKTFSLLGRSYRNDEFPEKFCCAGLIWYAYKKGAGIDLGDGIWFAPDDLFVLPGASIIFWRRSDSHMSPYHWHRIVQFKTYGR